MATGADSSLDMEGTSSLEMALDRATDRYMASLQDRRERKRGPTSSRETTALAQVADAAIQPARLSWRGIEVSPEFQEYAMRVARGEQLAPYRGPVLARPCPEFPWGEPPHDTTERISKLRAPGRAFGAVIGALALVMAALGLGVEPTPGDTLRAVTPLASQAPAPSLPAVMAEPAPLEQLGEEPIGSVLASAGPRPDEADAAERRRPVPARPVPPTVARAPSPRPAAPLAAAAAPARPQPPSPSALRSAPEAAPPLARSLTPSAGLQPAMPAGPAASSRWSLPSRPSAPSPAELDGPSALFADRPPF